jgi:hypothetical protein
MKWLGLTISPQESDLLIAHLFLSGPPGMSGMGRPWLFDSSIYISTCIYGISKKNLSHNLKFIIEILFGFSNVLSTKSNNIRHSYISNMSTIFSPDLNFGLIQFY